METPKQNEINQIIFREKLQESKLAEELSAKLKREKKISNDISPQVLNYQLHMAAEIKDEYYHAIKELFREWGIINGNENETTELSRLTIKLHSQINYSLSKFEKEVVDVVVDERITGEERLRLKYHLIEVRKTMHDKVDKTIDDLEKLIG